VSKNSWGYIVNQDYKSVDSIVDDLIDIVSKNGSLLLNIGPKPDGTIPEPEQQMLREIGGWLSVNGEAIYGTRPWRIYGEGPTAVVEGPFADTKRQAFTSKDVRFTTKGATLYAILLAWPADGRATITSLAMGAPHATREIAEVSLVGSTAKIAWTRNASGVQVTLPGPPPSDYAVVLRVSTR